MYAIVADSGRQYMVEEGRHLVVDFREVETGEKIKLERVLLIGGEGGTKVGKPVVPGAYIEATVLGPIQGEKIYVEKFRRRKNYRRRTGHRQIHTKISIDKIVGA